MNTLFTSRTSLRLVLVGAGLLFGVTACQIAVPPAAPPTNPVPAATAPPPPPATPAVVVVPTPTPAPVPTAAPAPAPGAAFAAYAPKAALYGRLRSVGSDTMNEVLPLWEKEFRLFHPSMRFYCEGKGSSTAMPALLEGRSDVGPMSRPPKDSEVAAFEAKFQYKPTLFRVAVDALAVYVHPSNPLARQGLDFTQLDAVFSSTRTRGGKDDIVTWGQLGLTGEWANAPIRLYGRNSASGTNAFFLEHVLGKGGKYKTSVREMVGSAELVQAVAQDRHAIGYSGIAYSSDAVAALPLSPAPGQPAVPANEEQAHSGAYPLARHLYLVLNLRPHAALLPLQEEWLRFVYSREGQECVRRSGFFSITPEVAAAELRQVGK